MTRTKLALFGLCAMVLGPTAFSAVAQAEGTWLILNAAGQLKTGAELPAIIEFEKDSAVYVLHAEILKIKVLVLCTGLKSVNAKIFGAGIIGKGPGEEKDSKILFSGCITDLANSPAPECTPKDPSDGEGFFVTKPIHFLAILHELVGGTKDDIISVLPDEGDTFGTLSFPAACPIGTTVPVIGKIALKDCENLALTHLVKHLLEPFEALTELFVISKTVEHKAVLLGSLWAKLGGEHAGLKWSISNL